MLYHWVLSKALPRPPIHLFDTCTQLYPNAHTNTQARVLRAVPRFTFMGQKTRVLIQSLFMTGCSISKIREETAQRQITDAFLLVNNKHVIYVQHCEVLIMHIKFISMYTDYTYQICFDVAYYVFLAVNPLLGVQSASLRVCKMLVLLYGGMFTYLCLGWCLDMILM